MKRALVMVLMVAALAGASPAHPEICAIDAVPAATLLLPYFEVDMGFFPKLNKAEQTIIVLQTLDRGAIANVTLWSDLGVPTAAFVVVLRNRAIERINLTELFYKGKISRLPIDLSGRRGFVLGETPSRGLQTVGELIRAHRGESVAGSCYGVFTGDNRARGYVTIDVVNDPTPMFPTDDIYFREGGRGIASNDNLLVGTVRVVGKKAIQANELVHIEAAPGGGGSYTFYGRYVGFDGRDGREPLGATWSAPFDSGKEPTELVVWRDSAAEQPPFDCNQLGTAGWYPLDANQVVAIEDSDNFFESDEDPDVFLFPAATQKVRVRSARLGTGPIRSGWIYLNLLENNVGLQSLVWVVQRARKNASVYPANLYTHACRGDGEVPSPATPIP